MSERVNLDVVPDRLRDWFEEGDCQKNIAPSLLGLDWSSLSFKFTNQADPSYMNSPEFIFLSVTSLDAFATSVLSSGYKFDEQPLLLECSLKRGEPPNSLRIHLIARKREFALHIGSTAGSEVSESLRLTIDSKEIGAGHLLLGDSGYLWYSFKYPGRMLPHKSIYLRSRPESDWPVAFLTITPTAWLRKRAREVVEFLRSDLIDQRPN